MLVAGSVGPYGACQHDGSEYTGKYVDNMTIQVLGKETFFVISVIRPFITSPTNYTSVIGQLSRPYSTPQPPKICQNVL